MRGTFAFSLLAFFLIVGAAGAKVAPLKLSEVKEITRVSGIPSTQKLKLKALSRFETPKAKVVLISAEDGKPTGSTALFRIAYRLLEEIAQQRPTYTFFSPDRSGDLHLAYNIHPSIAKRRYVVFLPWRPNGVPSAFTPTRPEKPFLAIASFFVHVDQSTRFDRRVKGNPYNVFVETCNQTLTVSITARSEKKLLKIFRERYPTYPASDAEMRRAIRFQQAQVGQELTCNSLAAAISFARTKIPYLKYRRTMSKARLTALGQKLSSYYMVVSQKTYLQFRNA